MDLPIGTPLYDIHNTFGAVYIGCLFSIGLLGMTIVQIWFYYDHFPKDPLWMKVAVMSICVIEALRSAFTSHAVYWYLVQNWENTTALDSIVWSLQSIILTTNVSKLFGYFFFSWRIFLCAAIAATIELFQTTSFAEYTGQQRILAPFAIATAMVTDAAISICLIFVLSRSKTGFSVTNRLLNTLIFYAIEVGLITVLASALDLALNHYVNDSNIRFDYISVYAITGNLYADSLLATLNARLKYKFTTGARFHTSSLLHVSDEDSQHRDAFFKRRNPASCSQTRFIQAAREVHLQTFVTTSVEIAEDGKHIGEEVLHITPKMAR